MISLCREEDELLEPGPVVAQGQLLMPQAHTPTAQQSSPLMCNPAARRLSLVVLSRRYSVANHWLLTSVASLVTQALGHSGFSSCCMRAQ